MVISSSPHEIIKLKRLCGFGAKEILVFSRPTTNATDTVSTNLTKENDMKLIYHPVTKGIISVLSVFISGTLCSALVAEIATKEGIIKWSEMYNKISFYLIIIIVIGSIIYTLFAVKQELDFRQAINNRFLDKFVNEKGLSTLAEQVTEAIKAGDKTKLTDLLDMKELITKNLEAK